MLPMEFAAKHNIPVLADALSPYRFSEQQNPAILGLYENYCEQRHLEHSFYLNLYMFNSPELSLDFSISARFGY